MGPEYLLMLFFSEQTTATAAVHIYLLFCCAAVSLLFLTIALGREGFSCSPLSPVRGS